MAKKNTSWTDALLQIFRVILEALELMPDNVKNSKSWIETGLYTFKKTPVMYQKVISELN